MLNWFFERVMMELCYLDIAMPTGLAIWTIAKSTSGYCFFLQEYSASIGWSSRLQKMVALSTAEAEYHSMSQECNLRNLLDDMGVGQNCPVAIHVDNQACIAISKNPMVVPSCRALMPARMKNHVLTIT